jgi:hypothetical protein
MDIWLMERSGLPGLLYSMMYQRMRGVSQLASHRTH